MGIDTIFLEIEEASIPYLKELSETDLLSFIKSAREFWPTMINAGFLVEHPHLPELQDEVEKLSIDPPPSAREVIFRAISIPTEEVTRGNFTIALAQPKKWWQITVIGSTTTVRYGAKKGPAKTSTSTHASNEDAVKFARDTTRKKKREGYKTQIHPLISKLSKELEEEKKARDEEETRGPPEKKKKEEEEYSETPRGLRDVLAMVLGFLEPDRKSVV